ncbi:MAG: serine hydrolase [Caldimicrobium sp.]|nr:serine hydrolase [Caldimicrobium sp.]MCX7612733.1 serine hydrolase [Caldimicrobium sp.]MDW8182818.1 serine hydrolase [Caldimicrobium sp.]
MKIIISLLIFIFIFFSSIKAEDSLDFYENISSMAGVALDGNTGQILYAKNPHIKIPPASIVKLLTAMVVLDRISLTQKIRISNQAESTASTPPHLREGEVYTVEDLLHLLLIKSSNQAAVALAEAVAGSEEKFSELMNQKAKMLGLKDSNFVTASGLPASNQYSTAYELSLLLYEALKYPHIKEIINTPVKIITSQQGRTIIIKNTNKLLFEEENRDLILGGKTGYTKLSKHCLVNVAKINNRLIVTSLLGAPSREVLWEDTKKLIHFSQMVLERKVSPVIINTAVNTALPASIKPSTYYKESKRSNQKIVATKSKTNLSQKAISKRYLAKNSPLKKSLNKSISSKSKQTKTTRKT